MSRADASASPADPATRVDAPGADVASAHAASADAVSARPARWRARFLRSELGMIFRRRRNQAMLVVLAAVPVLIAVAVRVHSGSGRGDGDSAAFFNDITDNGIFVSLAAMIVIVPLFLPMVVSVVSGDCIAGEANSGTLRYLLTVPVGRTRLLITKFAGIVVWCFVATATVAVAGVIIGLALFPRGEVVLLSGTTTSLAGGIGRLALVVGYVAVMACVVGAIGLFVSTLTEVPIAAMATTLVLTIASEVLDQVPQLHAIGPWLPSHYWLDFSDLLRDPMLLSNVQQGLLVALGYIAVFVSLAWSRFSGKDVTS
jgi:ABC-2 type transport system permease protein